MEQISKEQADWLIENGYINIVKGKMQDLIVTRRKIYASPDKADKLKFMK